MLLLRDALLRYTATRNGERKPAILWVLANQDLAELFDRVAHFENGRLAHDEPVETHSRDSDYKELAS